MLSWTTQAVKAIRQPLNWAKIRFGKTTNFHSKSFRQFQTSIAHAYIRLSLRNILKGMRKILFPRHCLLRNRSLRIAKMICLLF